MPFATARDGVRLYFEEIGQGEPLLLMAGVAQDHTLWDLARNDFVRSHRVILYDNRGTGQSDKPADPPYATRGFARDAVAILDHLDIARSHAFGVSMGGTVGQWLGIDHSERVGALVLAGTTPGGPHRVRRSAAVDAALGSGDAAARTRALLETLYSPQWIRSHPTESAAWANAGRAQPIPDHARRLHDEAVGAHDAWEFLPTVAAPTLVIHGSDDPLIPVANARLLAERIPGAVLHIVQEGRHRFWHEFHEQTSRTILDFLAAHPLANERRR